MHLHVIARMAFPMMCLDTSVVCEWCVCTVVCVCVCVYCAVCVCTVLCVIAEDSCHSGY